MNIRIVLGKSFGDEGKGLAVDYFARRAAREGRSCLVVRSSGGAQAGHTVDLPDRRFVFHQLSSGSFRGADTLWADTFLPDLYKLREEAEAFRQSGGTMPRLLASGACSCVVIDDVLVNMALETSRGAGRHGSCGMGINEAVQRAKRPEFRLTLAEVKGLSCDGLFLRLKELRTVYLPRRLEELGLSPERLGEYGELLREERVLWNAAAEMCRGAELVQLPEPARLPSFDEVLFEGAQGLLLDEEYTAYAPYLTSSRTGLHHPLRLCRDLFPRVPPEVVYVTRTYVTRHGPGPLPHEGGFAPARWGVRDRTNLPNEWQGSLRFAPHGTPEEFLAPILADLGDSGLRPSLFLTHLNETEGLVCTVQGDLSVRDWCAQYQIASRFDRLYLSPSPYAADVTETAF